MNARPEPTGVLAVDVGNTSTRFGLFVDGALGDTWEASTPERLTVDEARCAVGAFLGERVRRAGVAGVGAVSYTHLFADTAESKNLRGGGAF